tara:strand:+ start:2058 stop:2822 length:765 start_codon:yes stop_codon:yes gene_type:complete
MSKKIDFNCDMGESFGIYKMGLDEEVIKNISSANIACGFHAGDSLWMKRTVELAEQYNVALGAHPSFPDLKGFGRRNMNIDPIEVKADIIYQAGALSAFSTTKKIQHIKPHGAMYNQAVNDPDLAKAICESILEFDDQVILLALTGSQWVKIAKQMGLRVAREVFADRAINSDGTLVSRTINGSVIHDTSEVIERSLKMVNDGVIESINGDLVEVEADSICLHGDTQGAVELSKSLKEEFINSGISILPLGEIV